MSSGPVGLDVREYVYDMFRHVPPNNNVFQWTTHNNWLVTRIQAFAPAGFAAVLTCGSFSIDIAAGGCAVLEPNGAYRAQVGFRVVGGGASGGLLVVEYWYQARQGQIPQVVAYP